MLTQMLDEYIRSVKNKISDSESLKDNFSRALKEARSAKDDVANIIKEDEEVSRTKIVHMRDENEEYLKMLRKRFEISLETRLEAELAKQKDILVERLADQIMKRLSEKINAADCEVAVDFAKKDLQKLAGRSR